MFAPTLRSLFMRLPSTTTPLCRFTPHPSTTTTTTTIAAATSSSSPSSLIRSLHTTPNQNAKSGGAGIKGGSKGGSGGKKRKKKGKGEAPDPRILNLKSSMPRAVPSPLRFARNRALRHWTIHRAWLLYQRKEREREAHELERYVSPLLTLSYSSCPIIPPS